MFNQKVIKSLNYKGIQQSQDFWTIILTFIEFVSWQSTILQHKFIQLNNTIQKMQFQFNFKGKQMTSVNNFDQQTLGSPLETSNAFATAAKDDHQRQEERFYQLNDLNSQNSLSISIEKSFMTQHSAVFNVELKKYFSSAQEYLSSTHKQFLQLFFCIAPQNNSEVACRKIIADLEAQLVPSFKQKLLNDLKRYNKLQEFLDLVVKSCSTKIALELIQISEQVLDRYEKFTANEVGPPQLYELMNLAFDKSNNLEGIQFLDLRSFASSSQNYKKFKLSYQKFVEIYSVTTILVIAQFFQNPYFEKQSKQMPKRSLKQIQIEDDVQMEEEVSLAPQKKRKSVSMNKI